MYVYVRTYVRTYALVMGITNIFVPHIMTPHIHDMNIYHDIHNSIKHITYKHMYVRPRGERL